MFYLGLLWKFILLIIILLLTGKVYKKHKKIEVTIIYFGFYVYLLCLLENVFFPIMFDMPLPEFVFDCNLVPLKTCHEMYQFGIERFMKQIIGNVVLFVPMGFLIPIIYKKINNYLYILLFGILSSFTIELIQALINILTRVYNRSVDIDDILLNTLGAITGYSMLVAFRILGKKFLPSINWMRNI